MEGLGFVGELVPAGFSGSGRTAGREDSAEAARKCLKDGREMARITPGMGDYGGSFLLRGRAGYYCPKCETFVPD